MKVKEIMKTPAVGVNENATICEAVSLLSARGASELPVTDSSGMLVGIVSEHDFIRLLLPTYTDITDVDAALLDPTLMQDRALAVRVHPVSSIMTRNVVALEEEDTILKAASTMLSRKVRRIPIMHDGRLVGTITRMDVLEAVMRGGL